MIGDRRPSPDLQVREALEAARADGLPFADAWGFAVHGQVCDDYRSARGQGDPPAVQESISPGPPNLRGSDGEKRCAGCRYLAPPAPEGPHTGPGRSHCGLHDARVFAGVLWPHRTEDRRQWQEAIITAIEEWGRSYRGEPSIVASVLDAIKRRVVEDAQQSDPRVERGHVAA